MKTNVNTWIFKILIRIVFLVVFTICLTIGLAKFDQKTEIWCWINRFIRWCIVRVAGVEAVEVETAATVLNLTRPLCLDQVLISLQKLLNYFNFSWLTFSLLWLQCIKMLPNHANQLCMGLLKDKQKQHFIGNEYEWFWVDCGGLDQVLKFSCGI